MPDEQKREMPDADFICWVNVDNRDTETAVRYGHPANKVWSHNGKRYQERDLLKLIGSMPIYTLTVSETHHA